MTGEEVKQKAIVTLRSHVWNMPSPETAEEACAEALAALYPCTVLTAEETAKNAEALREGLVYAEACDTWPRGPHEKADHEGHKQDMRSALSLLTPDPIIPGYGSSI